MTARCNAFARWDPLPEEHNCTIGNIGNTVCFDLLGTKFYTLMLFISATFKTGDIVSILKSI